MGECQVLIAQVIEVWMHEGVNRADSFLRLVDKELGNQIDPIDVCLLREDQVPWLWLDIREALALVVWIHGEDLFLCR